MEHYYSLENILLGNAWLTIGSFDGVHLGHQAIIKKLVAGAHRKGIPAVVLTFYPHPAVVLGKRQNPLYISLPDERAYLMAQYGVDYLITHPFNKRVAELSASDFMSMLKRNLNLSKLCVGHDFALGRGREGNLQNLREIGERLNFQVEVIPSVKIDGKIVSSSRIREYIFAGKIEDANKLLGHPFTITGKVIHGDRRGQQIGIPTANLQIHSERILPKPGVYACNVLLDQQVYRSVTNVGFRPTFDGDREVPIVEAHILDFDNDVYGERMRLQFIHRLRDEKKFKGIDELVFQIKKDMEIARELFQEVS